MDLKQKLFEHCKSKVLSKLTVCNQRIQTIEMDLANESKSSAGDKHETARAMLQLEREKFGTQLYTIEKDLEFLERVNLTNTTSTIGIGSIVKTSKFNYFILISADMVKIEGDTFLCISSISPIGRMLMNQAKGDSISFNKQTFEILEVL